MTENDMLAMFVLAWVAMAVLYVAVGTLRAACWVAGKLLDYFSDKLYEFRDWWHAGGHKY